LFNPHDQLDSGLGGPTAGVAALSLDQAIADDQPRAAFGRKTPRRHRRFDLVHDLAEDIGSARWYRGLATMLGLAVVALAFWPDFSALEAATSVPAAREIRDEYRRQTIAPLAFGTDAGRHMDFANDLVRPLASAPERPAIQLTATLGAGDSFGRMLQRAGVGGEDAAQATQMIAAAVPIGDIAPGTRFSIKLGKRLAPGMPRPLDKLDFRARFDLALDISRQGGALALAKKPIAVDETPLRIRGTVGQGLYRSARASGAPVKAIQQYLQALDGQLNLESDILSGDRFDIIVAYKRSAGGESEVGPLLYAGLDRGGKPRAELLRWKGGQLMAASGLGSTIEQSVQTTRPMGMPVNGHMTSGFGLRRHPILGYTRMHAGIDFGAAWGSPIFAVSDGMVSYAGRHGGHGNYVRIEHGGGLGTGYGHMSRIAVAPGTRVRAGQVIGYVGSTGLSTGPHLHYEVYENGRTVNPLAVRFATTTTFVSAAVDPKELAAFKARLAQIKSVRPGAALADFGNASTD